MESDEKMKMILHKLDGKHDGYVTGSWKEIFELFVELFYSEIIVKFNKDKSKSKVYRLKTCVKKLQCMEDRI